MNQQKEKEKGPLPGKLKNRFRLKPNAKPPELNKFGNNRKRGKKEGKEKPLINNNTSGKAKKGIELYDKNGNKLAGTYVPAPEEGEKYDLYDKNGNKLDGKFKKIKGNAKIYDKNGNKLKGNYLKLLTPLHGLETYNKDGEALDGKYANILSCLPTEEVFDKDGNKLDGIFKKEEDDNDKIELFNKKGKKLDFAFIIGLFGLVFIFEFFVFMYVL